MESVVKAAVRTVRDICQVIPLPLAIMITTYVTNVVVQTTLIGSIGVKVVWGACIVEHRQLRCNCCNILGHMAWNCLKNATGDKVLSPALSPVKTVNILLPVVGIQVDGVQYSAFVDT